MLSYNSATVVSLLYVFSLWAVICTDHTHRFVRIQLTFVCDCVIFLCKSVGGFLLPSSAFSLSLIGCWSSLAQSDIGVHCLLAGNSFPAKRRLLRGHPTSAG